MNCARVMIAGVAIDNATMTGTLAFIEEFPRLCERATRKGYRLFFLGGRPGAARMAKERLERKFPSISIVGTHCPPFGFERDARENEKIEAMIRSVSPDILLVGLGAPKQEKWIYRHHKRLDVPVSIGVGASFEFLAGMVKRAPQWMQGTGLEWFWRLMMEPGRLWKRYLIRDMRFFHLILRQKLGGGAGGSGLREDRSNRSGVLVSEVQG